MSLYYTILTILLLCCTVVYAQTEYDATKPENWATASHPFYVGMYVSGYYTAIDYPYQYNIEVNGKTYVKNESKKTYMPTKNYMIGLYVDSWELEYRTANYGSVLGLGMRSVGKDVHSKVFVEYGYTPDAVAYYTYPGAFTTKEIPLPGTSVWTIGKRWQNLTDEKNMFSITEFTIGSYYVAPFGFNTIFKHLTINGEYTYGIRYAIQHTPVYLGVTVYFNSNTPLLQNGLILSELFANGYTPTPVNMTNSGIRNWVFGIRLYASVWGNINL